MNPEANLRAGQLLEATERDDFESVAAILSEIDRSGTTVEDAVNLVYAREYAEENDLPGLREYARSNMKVEKRPGFFWRIVGMIGGSELGREAGSAVPGLGLDLPLEDTVHQLYVPEIALGIAGIYAGYRLGTRFETEGRNYWLNENQIRTDLHDTYHKTGLALPRNTEKLREKLYREHGIDLYAEIEEG